MRDLTQSTYALESAKKESETYKFHCVIDYILGEDTITTINIYEGEPSVVGGGFSV